MEIPPLFLCDNSDEQILFECVANREYDWKDIEVIANSKQINLVEVRTRDSLTLLHVAAGFGRCRILKHLISQGADVNARDIEGQAPLHYASNHAHRNVAKLLIEAGAQVNLADYNKWTPLLFAVSKKENDVEEIPSMYWEVVRLLLENGANPFLPKDTKRNCFSRMRNKDQRLRVRLSYLIYRLKKLGDTDQAERESIIDKYLRVQDFFDLLSNLEELHELIANLTTNRLINSKLGTVGNITPLHRAAGYGQMEVAELFIDRGANINAEDNFKRTPLFNAVCHSHVDMIRLLCDRGSEINQQDSDGSTPLHLAAQCKTASACLELMARGADSTIKNKDGKLPYDLAETDEIREVLKIISDSEEKNILFQDQIKFPLPIDMQPSDECLIRLCSEKQPLVSQHEIKKLILSETDWPYLHIKKKMLETKRVHSDDLCGSFTGYDIDSIKLILHGKAWKKYQNMCEELEIDYGIGSKNEKLLFHGSSYVDRIVKEGFDHRYANRNGMFGAALYFAEHSSKSNQYTFGLNQGCLKHKDKCCYLCERKMILTLVALGKCKRAKEELPDSIHAPVGYSSVAGEPGPNLRYPEYAIYDGRQAYPLFVIKYRLIP